jgi:hypothetical protein
MVGSLRDELTARLYHEPDGITATLIDAVAIIGAALRIENYKLGYSRLTKADALRQQSLAKQFDHVLAALQARCGRELDDLDRTMVGMTRDPECEAEVADKAKLKAVPQEGPPRRSPVDTKAPKARQPRTKG